MKFSDIQPAPDAAKLEIVLQINALHAFPAIERLHELFIQLPQALDTMRRAQKKATLRWLGWRCAQRFS